MQHELIKNGQFNDAKNVNFFYNGVTLDGTNASDQAFIVPNESFPESLSKHSAEIQFVYWFKLGWCPANSESAANLMLTFNNLKLVITDMTRVEMLDYGFKIEKTIRFNDCKMKYGKSCRTMYMHILVTDSERKVIEAEESEIVRHLQAEELVKLLEDFEGCAEEEKKAGVLERSVIL